MTRQTVKHRLEPDDNKCATCAFGKRTALFELCTHEKSAYVFDRQPDFHTVNHMRIDGACGSSASLWRAR